MSKYFTFSEISVVLAVLLVCPLAAQTEVKQDLVLVSYNIHHGEGVDGNAEVVRGNGNE